MTCIDITQNSLSAAFRQQQITYSMEHLQYQQGIKSLIYL